jgi:hypothetical protein
MPMSVLNPEGDMHLGSSDFRAEVTVFDSVFLTWALSEKAKQNQNSI